MSDGTAPRAVPASAAASAAPVVLITGASSGLGRSCAEHLQSRGYRVYGSSRRASLDAPFAFVQMDVTSEDSVAQAVRQVIERAGRIDVVVNNAGDGIAGAVEDTSIAEAQQQLDTNFFGALRVCRAVLPAMRTQGSGLIVNVSSLGGLVALPFQGLYSASKFALEGMTEALRMEVKPHGVRVVLVEPGDFRTGFTAQRRKAQAAEQSVYAEHFKRALATMERDEHGGSDPAAVARLVERLINKPSPRLRYKVGSAWQKFAIGTLRVVLPQKLFEYLLAMSYGVN
jgi:NAD(P)-dependent dehydrogenase (short-subunit alcohol dehydrogenase family)